MAEIAAYFFDTYVFCELFKGNLRYKPYAKDISIVTTMLNLMELHYGMLTENSREYADMIYDRLKKFCVEIDDEIIKNANVLKAQHRKRNLSYVDCIGYTIAKSRKIRFLTGDRQFLDMDNVEYVK